MWKSRGCLAVSKSIALGKTHIETLIITQKLSNAEFYLVH